MSIHAFIWLTNLRLSLTYKAYCHFWFSHPSLQNCAILHFNYAFTTHIFLQDSFIVALLVSCACQEAFLSNFWRYATEIGISLCFADSDLKNLICAIILMTFDCSGSAWSLQNLIIDDFLLYLQKSSKKSFSKMR